MGLMDKLREDFRARRTRHTVLDTDVYVTPLTVDEETRLRTLHPTDAALRIAEMLVLKCRNEAGEPLFTKEDKQALKREVAGDRLGALVVAITGPGPEELEKK